MSRFSIYLTESFQKDIQNTLDYIEFTLRNLLAADQLLDDIEDELNRLSFSALQYPIIDEPLLRYWKIRFIRVRNYLAFYQVDERKRIVHFLRFLYQKRDWSFLLKEELQKEKQDTKVIVKQ